MNFSQRQADPRRHLVGIAFVILFHAFIVWALVSGLAKKVVEVVRAPIETKVIEEIKKPPPPPEVVVPPPPKMEAPPPPFIPPPEVQIATVSTMGYAGLLAAPPLLGTVAHVSTLAGIFYVAAVFTVIIALLAPVCAPRGASGRPATEAG